MGARRYAALILPDIIASLSSGQPVKRLNTASFSPDALTISFPSMSDMSIGASMAAPTAMLAIFAMLLVLAAEVESLRRAELPVVVCGAEARIAIQATDRKSTRLNSSHGYISYAVF